MCKRGLYGADQTEKVGAFRAGKKTVKAVPLELTELGKMDAFRKNGRFSFRANKTQKVGGGALPRLIPVLL